MVEGVQIHSQQAKEAQQQILTEDALKFLAALHRTFESTRQNLLVARETIQQRLDAGQQLDFPAETAHIRADPSWICAPPGPGLEDRRVEITGPTDRKMVINALNSGTKTFMADFEDANSPTFANMLNGQVNLRDAIRRQIDFESGGKAYKLKENPAVLIVRPRGWHLDEPRVTVDNAPMSASLFDFALYFFHNAHELVRRGSGPYFYLPKMEHYLEARLWNDVFNFSQSYIGMPHGTIRATVLIETLPAAFQMEEILFELRTHSAGLNCGRWDYIFSFIKRRRADRSAVLPDRKDVTMEVGFMDAYVRLLIQTCHKRRVAAMGGMSAQIPIKNDPKANEIAMNKVRADKLREVTNGHDGTWIAHPLINDIAMEIFNKYMLGPNQYHIRREDVKVAAADLLNTKVPGQITVEGVRSNVATSLAYSAAWLGGNGCIPLNWLMEDAATAEITRIQLWQWVKYGMRTADSGEVITAAYVDRLVDEIAPTLKSAVITEENLDIVSRYLKAQVRREWPSEFLTSDLMGYLAVRDGSEGMSRQIKRITLTSKKNWWMVELDEEEDGANPPPLSSAPSEDPHTANESHHRTPRMIHRQTPRTYETTSHSSAPIYTPPSNPSTIFSFPTPTSYSAPPNPTQHLAPVAAGSASELFKCVVKKPNVVQLEINGEMQSNAKDVTTQFLAELRVYTTLARHRNITAFLGCLENVGMVLEYLEGRTLYDVIREEADTLRGARAKKVDYHNQLLDGLTHLHSYGLSHGDLSLLNILVTFSSDTIKLFDFGRSVSADSVYASPDDDLAAPPVSPPASAVPHELALRDEGPAPYPCAARRGPAQGRADIPGHAPVLRPRDIARGVPGRAARGRVQLRDDLGVSGPVRAGRREAVGPAEGQAAERLLGRLAGVW
ncbi:hypothetical protein ONZ51_g8330 [Trametes cubensis]|uniref:malate synthase n=1 Tax=Trametes cubensis TaxID=1111947 RepID=A0AAD7TPR1_9APHY|nr:hypothetical protein ONZ51_g8330 [Trametes cubensis]